MRVKLRVWHFLLFMLVAAVVMRVTFRPDRFPLATKIDAAKVNTFGGELVALVGDENGPYKFVSSYVESIPIDKATKTKSSMWVTYHLDGQPNRYQVPTDDDFSSHVNIFKNPKGNHLVAVFNKPIR